MNDERNVTVHHRSKLAEWTDNNVLSVEPIDGGGRRRSVDSEHKLKIIDDHVRNIMNIHRVWHRLHQTNNQRFNTPNFIHCKLAAENNEIFTDRKSQLKTGNTVLPNWYLAVHPVHFVPHKQTTYTHYYMISHNQSRVYLCKNNRRTPKQELMYATEYRPARTDALCSLARCRHFSEWNDVMAAVLKVWWHIRNPTPSTDAYWNNGALGFY